MKNLILSIIYLVLVSGSILSQPVLEWENIYDRVIGPETFVDLKTDASGNTYSTGYFDSLNTGNHNIVTVKYNTAGIRVWIKRYDLSGREDMGRKIFIDNSGYVYVVGSAVSSSNRRNVVVIKYRQTGELVWANTYVVPGYTGDLNASSFGGAYYQGGIIYVAASLKEPSTFQSNITLYKISPDGSFTSTATGAASVSEISNDITLDASGNIYVIGTQVIHTPVYKRNGYLLKFTNTLGLLGSYTISDTARDFTEFKKIALNSIGNVIISGDASSTSVTGYFITASFTASSGVMNWYKRYSPPGGINGITMNDMAIDKSNSIILGGNFYVSSGLSKGLLCVYKHTGSLIRTNQLDSMLKIYSIAVDSISNVYAAGVGYKINQSIYKYDYSGIKKWNTGVSVSTNLRKLILVKPNSFYVCGGGSSYYDFVTARFSLPSGSRPGGETTGNEPGYFRLHDNYPNPFNPSTTIRFSVPFSGMTTLKVYDIAGREVESLVASNLEAGEHEVDFNASHLASGVYFYRLTSGNFTDVKKMMLVK